MLNVPFYRGDAKEAGEEGERGKYDGDDGEHHEHFRGAAGAFGFFDEFASVDHVIEGGVLRRVHQSPILVFPGGVPM